jgi:hypothetical protein
MSKIKETTERHEAFARLVVQGKTATEAFREIYPKAKLWKDETVYVKACLLKKKIKPIIQQIHAQATGAAVATILERKATLTEIIRGRVGNFVTAGADGVVVNVGPENINSPALESVKSRCVTTGEGDGKQDAVITEIKVRDPIAAIAELNKMERVYAEGTGDQQLVIILRDAPRIGIKARAIQKQLKA